VVGAEPTSGGGYDDAGGSSPCGGAMSNRDGPAARDLCSTDLLSMQDPSGRWGEVSALCAATSEPIGSVPGLAETGCRRTCHGVD
jgi:hypothetical protein